MLEQLAEEEKYFVGETEYKRNKRNRMILFLGLDEAIKARNRRSHGVEFAVDKVFRATNFLPDTFVTDIETEGGR